MLNSIFLLFDTLDLIAFMKRINAKPGGNGSWIGIKVIDEKRTTHWKNLYDNHGFHSM